MMQNIFRKMMNDKRGFTAIELLVVLLAGLILVASAGKLSDTVFSGTKRTKLSQGLTRLRANIQQLFAIEPTYSAITMQKLKNAGAFPSEFTNTGGTTFQHPFFGTVTVAVNPSDQYQFYIQVTNIPKEQCHKLLVPAINGQWKNVTVNGKAAGTSSLTAPCTDNTTMQFYSE